MRRLRRILPEGTTILVCYWSEADEAQAAKELPQAAEADAYTTSLPQAVELCIAAAKGELSEEGAKETPHSAEVTPFPVRNNTERFEQRSKVRRAPVH